MFPRFDNLLEAQKEQIKSALSTHGWTKAEQAAGLLIQLREQWDSVADQQNVTPEWYQTLTRLLQDAMTPAALLESVCRHVQVTPDTRSAFTLFTDAPRSLDILGRFSAGSPFLTQVLLRHPESLAVLAQHRRVAELKSREQFAEEARTYLQNSSGSELRALRKFQRREQLRIGMCDIYGLLTLQYVTLQLSLLADAMVTVCLELALGPDPRNSSKLTVLALGKHGGEELNYSSDIDLVLLSSQTDTSAARVARRLVDGLNEHLGTGFLYRVDLRLRPWGNAGPLVTTPESWQDYLQQHAQLWEKQALLKARFVAGDRQIAEQTLSLIPKLIFTESESSIRQNIRSMKDTIESYLARDGREGSEVKLGVGSIRDVEFLVQALQLIHGAAEPRIRCANTLESLIRLADFGSLNSGEFQQLRDGYVFLRAIEHALQLQHNRQTHEIPNEPDLRNWLALRVDYPDEESFMERFNAHRQAIRAIYERHFQTARAPHGKVPNHPTSGGSNRMKLAAALKQSGRPLQLMVQRVLRKLEKEPNVHAESMTLDSHVIVLVVGAPDQSEMLTVMSGIMFISGFDIREGRVVTGPATLDSVAVRNQTVAAVFVVQRQTEAPLPDVLIAEVQEQMRALADRLKQDEAEPARQELIAFFCRRMEQIGHDPALASDVSIADTPAADRSGTVIRIQSSDNPGFLFEFCNALDVCQFRVRNANIGASEGHAEDQFTVTEIDTSRTLRPARIREIHTTVALLQQFTLWLQTAVDPGVALLRLRRLLGSMSQSRQSSSDTMALRHPDTLRKAARVLGLSRHLWQNALRQQTQFIEMLADPELIDTASSVDNLRNQLRQLCVTSDADKQRAATESLNTFKDQQLFRIELRHVLGHCQEFGAFSQEVTSLAEVILERAVDIAQQQLQLSGQEPPAGQWAMLALGKFGGTEMGYASDVELLLLFDSPDLQSAGRWYERLLAQLPAIVNSPHDGILEIDFRMKPWGQAGSPAVSLEQFEDYYSADGNAWPYERQSMIKMRPFCGDSNLASRISDVRDRIIYDERAVDFTAMQGLRQEQIRQHVPPGVVHAKLSEGCLVDLEYSVQALQLTYGHRIVELRQGNTIKALQAAEKSALLTQDLALQVTGAYRYFRQLIDCLRMARGNAKDLQVPATNTQEGRQLDRRLRQIYGETVNLDELPQHQAVAREFVTFVYELCQRADD